MMEGARIHVLGRLSPAGREALNRAETSGATLCARSSAGVTHTVLSHSVAARGRPGRLPGILLSEIGFLRAFGLAPPPATTGRTFSPADLARLARLDEDLVAVLGLFDLLDPVDGRFDFRDLASAREASRLLDSGVALGTLLAAGAALRGRGVRLSEASLQATSWGTLATSARPFAATLDGQFVLDLGDRPERPDDLFDRAAQAEADGDWALAERLYRAAAQVDRTDPVPPFNLGNVLREQGRVAEAQDAYLEALKRDPLWADAHYNMALVRSAEGAERSYRAALRCHARHPSALFNLALLLTRRGDHAEALDLWDRFLLTRPAAEDTRRAGRAMAMCRMALAGRNAPCEEARPAGSWAGRPFRA